MKGVCCQLGRSCGINKAHARNVTRLALEIFDSAKEVRLHNYGDWERELLEYAAFLHDIGSFISFTNHHAHSYYIIKNSELLGFDQKEIDIMANIAKFHRKKKPRKKHLDLPEFADNDSADCAGACHVYQAERESDRSHAGFVQHAEFVRAEKNEVILNIVAESDCRLESGAEAEQRTFERVFQKRLKIEVITSNTCDGQKEEENISEMPMTSVDPESVPVTYPYPGDPSYSIVPQSPSTLTRVPGALTIKGDIGAIYNRNITDNCPSGDNRFRFGINNGSRRMTVP